MSFDNDDYMRFARIAYQAMREYAKRQPRQERLLGVSKFMISLESPFLGENPDNKILGQYLTNSVMGGKTVVIYYGSFRYLGYMSLTDNELKEEISETITQTFHQLLEKSKKR